MAGDRKQEEPSKAQDNGSKADAMDVDQPAEKREVDVIDILNGNVQLIDKSVQIKETRLLMGRTLRQTAAVRKRLTKESLTTFLEKQLPAGCQSKDEIFKALNGKANNMDCKFEGAGQVLPEVEAYCYLLALLLLIDQKANQAAQKLSVLAVNRLQQFNRRTLDLLASRIYSYYSFAHELMNQLADIRTQLLGLHRLAVLRLDDVGQETVLNLLLRNYLHYSLYEQAEQLRAKSQRNETARSSQQQCRYLYYLGRIKAVQLEYSEAKECLQQAVRKAPTVARGFRITVTKWLIPVRLLLGEIPDRMEFAQPSMKQALLPYLHLTQAVRAGDLAAFKAVAAQHHDQFARDATAKLIERLRQNVIRTGLRRIELAYSRISLLEVQQKLGLSSVEDTESVVSKAIRDGGMDAAVEHQSSEVRSRSVADIYSTPEPASQYHARIAFCIDIHNQAVQAMRFEPEQAAELEDAAARKERLAQEEELAKSIAEDPDAF